MSEVHAGVETPVNPTEDPDKVSRAVRNLFPLLSFAIVNLDARRSKLQGSMNGLEGLENLKRILREEAIRDAAHKILWGNISGSSIVAYLNKQAAFAGKASFCERYDESPLGPITLTITAPNPEEVVEWLAPSSRRRQRSEK